MTRRLVFVPILMLFAKSLPAQDLPKSSEFIPLTTAPTDRVKIMGWDRYLKFSLSGSMTDNNDVVGKDNGQSTTVGGKLDGALDYKMENSEWLNTLSLFASASRTPLLPRYVKVDDTASLESLYKYFFNSGFGSYTRFNIDAPMFKGYDSRTSPSEYRITRRGGTVQLVTDDRLKLTDEFRPLKVREGFGLFTSLYNQEILRWDVKIGLGLRQTYAVGQLVLKDDKATAPIEVVEIKNSSKAGYEVGTDLGGNTSDKKFSYKISANVLFPFYEKPDNTATGNSQFEKRVVDVTGNLSFHLVEWASLDYVLRALRDPSILPRAQVSQSYLFSLNKVLAARRE